MRRYQHSPCEHQLADLLGIPRQVDGEDGLTGHVIVPTPLRDEQTSLSEDAWKRPCPSLDQSHIVKEETYAHISVSFTRTLDKSKHGTSLEQRNVLVPHKSSIIDKTPSVHRKASRHKSRKNLRLPETPFQKTHLPTLSRQAPAVVRRARGAFAARQTAEAKPLQNTTMTRDERHRREAKDHPVLEASEQQTSGHQQIVPSH